LCEYFVFVQSIICVVIKPERIDNMKKIVTLLLVFCLMTVVLCSCGPFGDGEAGDKGNIQTNDAGDGGNAADSPMGDIEEDAENTKDKIDEGMDNIKEDVKNGMEKADDILVEDDIEMNK